MTVKAIFTDAGRHSLEKDMVDPKSCLKKRKIAKRGLGANDALSGNFHWGNPPSIRFRGFSRKYRPFSVKGGATFRAKGTANPMPY